MTCAKCGTGVTPETKFCPSCGTSVTGADSPSVSSAPGGERGNKVLGGIGLLVAAFLGYSGLQSIIGAFGDVGVAVRVTEAEQILKRKLMSPASYDLVEGNIVWQGQDAQGNDAFIVRLDYDAQNGFGATLRGCMFVSYAVKGENLYWNETFGVQSCDTGGAMNERQFVELLVGTNFKG